ncbi:NAD(P)H-hydrate epimerase [Dokdonia sp.]|uniref:NAD(P)H-hydrate epimerase n=1 Tax=Dokdonia sp. TaxID=2024995 RepID=UPI0032634EDC
MSSIVHYPIIKYSKEKALTLQSFMDMDYYAVAHYNLPIELMMENAGYQLAQVISKTVEKTQSIKIGVGNGNNGGGGLVAARRLAAWGYLVYIDPFTEITKELPKAQLKRALKFGASLDTISQPDVWVDAYLGFSQKLPLRETLEERIIQANASNAQKIVLDIPTGYLGNPHTLFFEADTIVTLAAPKKILYDLPTTTKIYIVDLGIPATVYNQFQTEILPFDQGGILQLKRY